MKELGKWQIISFASRSMAMLLGLVQTFVIIRVLSVGEWGVIQLAISIGGALGIYQHLGLASASTREISSASDDKEVFKIFITSAVIRYAITVPIAIGLFLAANYVAVDIYKNEVLVLPIKIYALTLLFQGVQSILNSVISGTKRFKQLFLYQIAIAAASVVIFIPLVLTYRVNGYFYAFFMFNVLSSIILGYIAFKPLRGSMQFPSRSDFNRLFKEIFSISMAIYLVKIIYTNWEKFGTNVLGLFNSPEVIAIFAFALLYAKKLMSISDAVTDVSLPVLSEKYVKDFADFKRLFTKNFDKIFISVIAAAAFASYWAPEIVNLVVGGDKYQDSYVLIAPVIFAFILYSFINIVKSSVLIPAKMVKHMIAGFALLIAATAAFFFGTYRTIGALPGMAWGMAFGSAMSFLYISVATGKKLKFSYFNIDHLAILAQAFSISMIAMLPLNMKIAFFPFLFGMLIWAFFIPGYLTKKEVQSGIEYAKKFVRALKK
ncbi:MAG: Polysaccharide biosynthesis protein [candidate division WWE3 bacterium GW2011_GWF2_41_45]|uniref:Polysaccharide biosynthesis protein C-terminal domain-containing protein n=3 Tax=Katanobacteria TaxID=422282 RepID=A0A1F4W3Y3_UNCKA|nr:MAG: Polysaccharide biosynthesis protein [candidate division WWE3 bacterium GW2011_GWF2_41_45]KKS12460.1 MAG: Polysaccharide biosynthesis protein [candidate division WWE3 bacterium GW2011_GWF1_41_53]KKS20161.1 MAG: Polysaccharide biosynthesis protein [candidate division WWE3 bacterium GW2011_GWE1_41_72]KKS60393.1 MAG: Polysaccharide biosynthesis protein [candidate division WWE3 bacterium GW2011_GWB1_42_41]KKS61487.1 MAG: Polysaccharide biosynthesis protein [candidate division WWE3 bacterium 